MASQALVLTMAPILIRLTTEIVDTTTPKVPAKEMPTEDPVAPRPTRAPASSARTRPLPSPKGVLRPMPNPQVAIASTKPHEVSTVLQVATPVPMPIAKGMARP